ncbi:MAG: hypothetical protein QOF39_559 [Frankiales bacterium]|nr:hypothetical protein [Frankiales bacterium]
MSALSSAETLAPERAPTGRLARAGLVAARFVLSAGVAALVGALIWWRQPTQLSRSTDIIGYPTWADFYFPRTFLAYRLAVWELPLVTLLSYALLRWKGPLRLSRPEAARPTVALVDEGTEVGRYPLLRLLIVLPPAALVGVAVSTRPVVFGGAVTTAGIVAAVCYVLVVYAAALILGKVAGRGRFGRQPLELVNAAGCVLVAFGAVAFFAQHCLVQATNGQRHYWHWFPAWALVLLIALGLGWTAWRLRSGWSPAQVERPLRRVLVGSAILFLATGAMPATVGGLGGFDDMQSVTGAGLLSRGYFPWRDFLFIHGLFEDALRSSLGFVMFQHTYWGSVAGSFLIVAPLCWVSVYVLGSWSSRHGGLIGLGVVMFALWNGVSAVLFYRFIALPVIFVLLGEALRRKQLRWTAALAVAVFVDGLLVPESSFQAGAISLVLIGSDLVHRDAAASWRTTLRRSGTFFGTGAVLVVVWAVFLAANHALGSFVQYYRIFGPGHAASGAIPVAISGRLSWGLFYLTVVLVVLTLATTGWRLLSRRSWTPRDWVTVAAAITAGLYEEKLLGRFDGGHLLQTVGVALSLWTLWAATILDAADGLVVAVFRRVRLLRPVLPMFARVATVAVLLVTFVQQPIIRHQLWHIPQTEKSQVNTLDQVPLVGYSAPAAMDPTLLPDLDRVLDTYGGPMAKVFDNTNSLGYFYYLLGRAPASAFVHVSMAEPEYAQKLLTAQLSKSRPPLVAFDDDLLGLPAWDGPRNNVRHFEVAQYLLDGWTPILRTHSVLFLLRNDLVKNRPEIPVLSVPPSAADLYFSSANCDWGDTPNFLSSRPSGRQLDLAVHQQGSVRFITVSGWAYDIAHKRPVRRIVVAAGGVIVGHVDPGGPRPDVATAIGDKGAATSGFSGTVSTTRIGGVRVYAELADGTAVPLHGTGAVSAKALTTQDGGHIPVVGVTVAESGSLDHAGSTKYQLASAALPAGTTLTDYQVATVGASRPLSRGLVMLTDNLPGQAGAQVGQRLITASTLDGMGDTLSVRVGSCLQWHGYDTSTLYVLQVGGTPVTSLRLSGVRD